MNKALTIFLFLLSTVNQAGIDYSIKVSYICFDDDNPKGSVGYSKYLHYNPGDLYDVV